MAAPKIRLYNPDSFTNFFRTVCTASLPSAFFPVVTPTSWSVRSSQGGGKLPHPLHWMDRPIIYRGGPSLGCPRLKRSHDQAHADFFSHFDFDVVIGKCRFITLSCRSFLNDRYEVHIFSKWILGIIGRSFLSNQYPLNGNKPLQVTD